MSNKKVLVGTRKGLLVLEKKSGDWKIIADHFMGIPVNMVFEDSRSNTWWVALDHGHWGNKMHYSNDQGGNWTEVDAPQYPEGEFMKEDVPASLKYIWAFAHGGKDHPGSLFVGTEPGGLFHRNGDSTFTLNMGLWNQPTRMNNWFGGGRDYPGIHSIVVDPRDSDHIYIGISCAGVFETMDRGETWAIRNKGLRADFLPDPYAEVGHDPHLLVACAAQPDVMWQQNHCGIFRSTDGAQNWTEVSEEEGPAKFGFAIAADADNPQRAWVAPAISDETRVAVEKAVCISRTDDGGKTWQSFRKGLPQSYAYDIVYRHALIADGDDVLFGTTTGNLFASGDGGESWTTVSNFLPMVYGLTYIS